MFFGQEIRDFIKNFGEIAKKFQGWVLVRGRILTKGQKKTKILSESLKKDWYFSAKYDKIKKDL